MDRELRALERATDLTALEAERLKAARTRLLVSSESVIDRIEREAVARIAASDANGSTALSSYSFKVDALADSWRRITGQVRLARGVPAALRELADRIRQDWPKLTPRTTAALERTAREDEERKAAALAVAAAQAPRALGWVDVQAARDSAEGTGKQRYAPMEAVKDCIRAALQSGSASWEADKAVARSYRYPVSYTRVRARRTATGDVLVTFTRTQTWGRRADTTASIVVPRDLAMTEPT